MVRMEMNGKVAILLASFNGEKYIEAQLNSLLAQSYTNFTVYIHDDGSTDNTLAVINRIKKSNPERVALLEYTNPIPGSAANFISLIKYANEHLKEPYVMFSDQDDIWLPDKIEKELLALKQIEEEGRPALVYCNQQIVDESLQPLYNREDSFVATHRGKAVFSDLVFRNVAPGCTMIINKKLLSMMAALERPEMVVMHDWWAVLIACCYGKIKYVDEKLMLYRQHGDNQIGSGQRGWKEKLVKYLVKPQASLRKKRLQVEGCKNQIKLLSIFQQQANNQHELTKLQEIFQKSKLSRIRFLWKHGYIDKTHWLTTLFV